MSTKLLLTGLMMTITICLNMVWTLDAYAQSSNECEGWIDIESGSEMYEDMKLVCELGWIKGGDDNSARLDKDITRIEMVTIVNRIMDVDPTQINDEVAFDKIGELFDDQDFDDFNSGQVWMYRNLALGIDLEANFNTKLWSGYPDEKFRMNRSINTVEFLKIFMLALEKQDNLNGNFRLSQFNGENWYSNYVNFLDSRGVFDINDGALNFRDDSLELSENLKRGDVVKIIVNILERDVYVGSNLYEYDFMEIGVPYYLKEVEVDKSNLLQWVSIYDDLDLKMVKVLNTSSIDLPENFVSVFVPSKLTSEVENLYRTDKCGEGDDDCVRVYWFEMKDGGVVILEGNYDKEKTTSGQEAVNTMMRSVDFN